MERDSQRAFNKSQRQAIYLFSGGMCQSCGQQLGESWHADHVMPYSKGGETDVANGQALCPQCNLTKGNKYMKPRKWQTRCMEQFFSGWPRDRYSVMAFPGAGKTGLTFMIAQELKKRGDIDIAVVIAPYENLKEQWVQDATEWGMEFTTRFEAVVPGIGILVAPDFDGISTSYQQVSYGSYSEAFRKLCSSCNVLAIFDEPHHCGDEMSWGASIIKAFELAKCKLSITGTPFRTDSRTIPFLNYKEVKDENGQDALEVDMDFTYGYGRLLEDSFDAISSGQPGIIRQVQFPHFDGEVVWSERASQQSEIQPGLFEWVNEPVYKKRTLSEVETLNDKRKALAGALIHDTAYMDTMLSAADERLNAIRLEGHRNAGGLVTCIDTTHAREIAKRLEELTGEKPVVITWKTENALGVIKSFTKSNQKWLVSVKKISEGINIKRLRVCVFASTTTTRLFFLQILGRILRWVEGVDGDQYAYFYMPEMEPFLTYASEITDLISEVLKKKEETKSRERHPSDQSVWTDYIDATGEETGRIYSGESMTNEEIRFAQEISKQAGVYADPVAIARVLKHQNIKFPQERSTRQENGGSSNSVPLRDRKPKKSAQCNGLIRILYKTVSETGHTAKTEDEFFSLINGAWKSRTGIRPKLATLDQLQDKTDWVRLQIDMANQHLWREDTPWELSLNSTA